MLLKHMGYDGNGVEEGSCKWTEYQCFVRYLLLAYADWLEESRVTRETIYLQATLS